MGGVPVALDDKQSHALGLNEPICRRDFLNAALLASGGALLSSMTPAQLLAQQQQTWGGYTGEGDYRNANGNTREVMQAAHSIRDGAFDRVPADVIDTGELFDCVVVGGGISGLAAALYFHDQVPRPDRKCLVLENHPIFGGEAKRNEFVVNGQTLIGPQGSNQWFPPIAGSMVAQFYERIGFDWNAFQYQTWGAADPEIPLSKTSYEFLFQMPPTFGFYFGGKFGSKPGVWLKDIWTKKLEGTPIPRSERVDLLRWKNPSSHQQRSKYPGDEISRRLDAMSVEDYMIQDLGISRENIRKYSLALGHIEAWGLGPDALSAYAGYQYLPNAGHGLKDLHAWPGGNAGVARQIVKTLIPDAIEGTDTMAAIERGKVNFASLDRKDNPVSIRLGATVARVEHDTDPARSNFVNIIYSLGGKTYRVRALSAIMAGGCWITPHIVRDLPATHREAFSQFNRSACLVANVAVRNWRFLYNLGISGGRWFDGLGLWTEVRKMALFASDQKTIGPDSPTVLTLYVPLFYPGLPTKEQGTKGRIELMSTSFVDYERQIREQFTEMFGPSGFDARRDIAGIVLNRWGHAFVNPQPGFFFGKDGKPAPRDVLRNAPFGRIAFANTDLSGVMDHPNAVMEGHRAAYQVLGVVS
jgi:spermidine dehydrogenase